MVGFPLLLIPLAIYNIIVFLMPGVSLAEPLVKLTLMSGAEWPVTLSDILLALGIVVLLLEVIKGARPGAKYLTDHLLSLIVFGGAVAEFLLWPRFGNSTYLPARAVGVGGFPVGPGVARAARDAGCGRRSGLQTRCEKSLTSVAAEPQFDPAPPPKVPAAASVAESVLLDHPQPKTVARSCAGRTVAGGHVPGVATRRDLAAAA